MLTLKFNFIFKILFFFIGRNVFLNVSKENLVVNNESVF